MIDRIDKEFLKRDRAALEGALREGGTKLFKGKTCQCPFHDDQHPSASIDEVDGVWLFCCHVCKWGGDVIDVLARVRGKRPEDILQEISPASGNGHAKKINGHDKSRFWPTLDAMRLDFPGHVATYAYTHPETRAIEFVVERHLRDGQKRFSQIHPVEGGFEEGGIDGLRPLYNRIRLATCESPLIVEGELCVHALAAIGVIATTSPGGAQVPHKADWTPLNGKSRVTIWRDNDPAGLEYQNGVIAELRKLPNPPPVFVVDPAAFDIPPKGDCVNFIEAWGDGDAEESLRAVRAVIDSAASLGAAKELETLYEDTIAGRRIAPDFPWRLTSTLTQALLPGTVTTICGEPEAGKSFWILEAVWFWARHGLKPALFAMEEDLPFHQMRANAQMAEESRLTDAEWVKSNPDETRRLFNAHKEELEKLGAIITVSPDTMVRLPELNEWIEAKAAAGCQIIAVDPVTAAETGSKPWIEDKVFLIRAKAAMRRYGSRLILVSHPRIGVNLKPGLASISGGAAYPRFSQTVLWIVKHDRKSFKISTRLGPTWIECNRTLRIVKARNARGGGQDIGFTMEPRSLRFAEQGIIEKDEHGTDET